MIIITKNEGTCVTNGVGTKERDVVGEGFGLRGKHSCYEDQNGIVRYIGPEKAFLRNELAIVFHDE